ncbi:hypothetical protein [Candidatus Uabimicrobium amorphum]|uniref:Uncharacterized protein n=1 Tax=Uabimicrobium amorphum TaxID=2596890 RepID=A0A5S9F5X1_UABAM|nr:hypothetical protein [Candidatus Uabimicrobium amorphum]BBM87305.1 hypothetical protein UABAM_05714 [Candidatus Uabimicrobium amorphum]
MKIIFCAIILIASLCAQPIPFDIEIEELTFHSEIPALHSFSLAEHKDEWLVVGGLTDGTHGDGEQVFATGQFPRRNFNKSLWVISPKSGSVHSVKVPQNLSASLNVANAQHYQVGSNLYIVGGYGLNEKNKYDTMGVITCINVPLIMEAIKKKQSITKHIWQVSDERFRVTGGELKHIDGDFFLVAGQKFIGKYMGNEKQQYTFEIRRFQVDHDSKQIKNYQAIGDDSLYIRESNRVTTLANKKRFRHDLSRIVRPEISKTVELHKRLFDKERAGGGNDKDSHLRRRDLNVTEAVFPDGTRGFTLYGGGFQYSAILPSMHQSPIFFTPQKNFANCHAMIDMSFEQTMSLYTCAHMILFDSQKASLHTVMFGGISAHVYDERNDEVVRDRMLPYVNNISVETISGNKSPQSWQSKETIVKKDSRAQTFGKDGFFGTNAKFILNSMGRQAVYQGCDEVMDIQKLQQLTADSITVGYIYGGIQALKQNFGKTKACNKIFAVRLKK